MKRKQKGPRPGLVGTGNAGGTKNRCCQNPTTGCGDRQVADFLARTYEAERRCVAAGWYEPIGLHDAAYQHGVRGDRFANRECGFLYSYLATCAELKRVPDVDEAAHLGRDHDADFTAAELLDLLIGYGPTGHDDIDDLMAAVAFYHRSWERARRHLRMFIALVGAEPSKRTATLLSPGQQKSRDARGGWLRATPARQQRRRRCA